METERNLSHSKILDLTNMLHERSIEAANEKKAMRDFLKRLEIERGLSEEQTKAEPEYSAAELTKENTVNSEKLADYFIRITSINNDKFA